MDLGIMSGAVTKIKVWSARTGSTICHSTPNAIVRLSIGSTKKNRLDDKRIATSLSVNSGCLIVSTIGDTMKAQAENIKIAGC